ncbi:hypothetical protein DOTSEDRAFT_34242 [Dothistroma septosporum NZE10]|uniref:Uncharacterized protein n=1 Tax=Dothistroma septosporum (strain NZE10 / CBS 128990) TaxID=675120 RepID=N1PQZ3_DOTSN|nr:hypothetical protein DOTSEDRAFT_34242 [Dothistroma septosporum NZE10]
MTACCVSSFLTPAKRSASTESQSLAFVLSLKVVYPNAHISILDVAKLDPLAIILSTWTMLRILGRPVTTCAWEYLAFGIIYGACYQTVPLHRIMECGAIENPYSGRLTAALVSSTTFPVLKSRGTAIRAGKLYGADFQLAVATYLLALTVGDPKIDDQALLTMLNGFPVPAGTGGMTQEPWRPAR